MDAAEIKSTRLIVIQQTCTVPRKALAAFGEGEIPIPFEVHIEPRDPADERRGRLQQLKTAEVGCAGTSTTAFLRWSTETIAISISRYESAAASLLWLSRT
jgi:hypothetical protein